MKPALLIPFLLLAAPTWAEQQCDTTLYPLSAPSERFADNGDGTVSDNETGLMWMRCSAGQQWAAGRCNGEATEHSWDSSKTVTDDVNRGGSFFFNDWRVPRLPELATIAERQCKDPRINLDVFPDTPPSIYWTTSKRPGAGNKRFAYAMDFGAQGVLRLPTEQRHLVRLVRTGP